MFPVTSSNIQPAALSAFLLERYALAALPDCRLLRAGINHSYLVNDGVTRFVFRIYSLGWRSEVAIREELRLLDLLHAKGLSVSYGIPDRRGEMLQELPMPEGERFGVMFSYAPGDKIIEGDPVRYRDTGALMGRMHGLTAGMRLERVTYSWQTMVTDSLPKLGAFLPVDCVELLQLSELLESLRPELEPALSQHPQGAVHLDVWFDNLNVTPEGKITLFDFDFCGNGPLALDAAYNLMQLYFLEPDRFENNAAAFLGGYRSQRELSEAEMRAIPGFGILLYVFYLGVQCERFGNYSSVFLSATYLKRYIQARILKYAGFRNIIPAG